MPTVQRWSAHSERAVPPIRIPPSSFKNAPKAHPITLRKSPTHKRLAHPKPVPSLRPLAVSARSRRPLAEAAPRKNAPLAFFISGSLPKSAAHSARTKSPPTLLSPLLLFRSPPRSYRSEVDPKPRTSRSKRTRTIIPPNLANPTPLTAAIGRLRPLAKAIGRSRTSKKRPIGVFHQRFTSEICCSSRPD